MARLAAIACVALAAKIEETRMPLLLNIQLYAIAAVDPAVARALRARLFGGDCGCRLSLREHGARELGLV
jgi:hypothetical protein